MSLSKKNYDARVISIFEIIGCYFVDIFYNHVYINARSYREMGSGARRSVTDEYKAMVKAYVRGVKTNQENYLATIKGLHKYYQTFTKFSTISFVEFIDDILSVYVPTEHLEVMNGPQKSAFLSSIINEVTSRFANEILSIDMLRLVIDDHQNAENPRVWVDHIQSIQISIRESVFSKFARKELGIEDKVDKNLYDELKIEKNKLLEKLKQTITEKCKIDTNYNMAKKATEVLFKEKTTIEEEFKARVSDLEQQIRAQNTTIEQLRAQLNNLMAQKSSRAEVLPEKVELAPNKESGPETPELTKSDMPDITISGDLPPVEDEWANAAKNNMIEFDSDSENETDYLQKQREEAKARMLASLKNNSDS